MPDKWDTLKATVEAAIKFSEREVKFKIVDGPTLLLSLWVGRQGAFEEVLKRMQQLEGN